MNVGSVLFWLSLALILYAYVGYPVLLRFLPRKPLLPQAAVAPLPVSIILAVHNEEIYLPRKLAGLYSLDYDPSLIEIVIASDGSTDRTNAILAEHAGRVSAIILPMAGGKASALNAAVANARGDILVFMDARQSVAPDVVRQFMPCFADPQTGAVSGELLLEAADGSPSPDALGIYWKVEKLVRKLESSTGSVVGVTGALFAMRRSLYRPLPPGTLLDDVLTPMHVARQGKRVLFLDSAVARDRVFAEPKKEFRRKVRTLTGNYQLLQLAPWLLTSRNPLLFRFLSHKLLRLAVPFLLLTLLLTSALAGQLFYQLAFLVQLLLYTLALVGTLTPGTRRWRPVSIAYTFTMLNAAAALAFYNFVIGRKRWA